jgi:hypothetical protein
MTIDPERYSEKEARRRFEAALRGGLNTLPLKTAKKKKKKKAPLRRG